MPQPCLFGAIVSLEDRGGGRGRDIPESEAEHYLGHGVVFGKAAEHGG